MERKFLTVIALGLLCVEHVVHHVFLVATTEDAFYHRGEWRYSAVAVTEEVGRSSGGRVHVMFSDSHRLFHGGRNTRYIVLGRYCRNTNRIKDEQIDRDRPTVDVLIVSGCMIDVLSMTSAGLVFRLVLVWDTLADLGTCSSFEGRDMK